MRLVALGKILYIQDLGESAESTIVVEFPKISDGTAIDIYRGSDNKYHHAVFKDGKAFFHRCFFEDGDYRICIKAPGGALMSTEFAVSGGNFERIARAMGTELSRLWEALIAIDEKYSSVKEEIDKLVLGYETE